MNRREFLRTAAGALGAGPAGAAPRRPNILLLLADDLGYGDVGFTGCPDIRTPRIDALAAEGVHFTHAYANGPVCSPTRTALLTGQYQQRHGMDSVIIVNERERGLSPDAFLIPEALKPAGYATGIVGKWHLGFEKRFFPTRQGFDEFYGFLSGNIDYFSHTDRLGNRDLWKQEELVNDDRYMSRLIADESISFIDRHAREPFFLYVPFNAPHDPFQGPGDRATAGDQEASRKKNRTRPVYRSMVEALDANIGRILDHLKARGLDENTAVFFFSDNGGVPQVGRNLPFRGFKGSLWEGGIRTPFVARWKGQWQPGKCAEMAAGFDIFPTILSITGTKLPAGHTLDGVDLAAACRGKGGTGRDSLFFHAGKQGAMVRTGWKYLREAEGAEHLFHLTGDIGEKTDLAAREPARLATMKREYDAWERDVLRGESAR
jgi:arylsulfatase A-like enzyme